MATRNWQFKVEPLALWADGANGRREVVGQHESLFQVSIQTPQTRRAQQFPVEHKADRDALVKAFTKAIDFLTKLDNLPDAPDTTAKPSSSVAKLPDNVVTADMLQELLAKQAEQSRQDMLALVNAMMQAQQTPAPSSTTAKVSGNGQTAVKSL